MDEYITVNLGQTSIKGYFVDESGELHDFMGTLKRTYNSLSRASTAARRKYANNTITVTECKVERHRYRVPVSGLMEIAEEI